MAVSVFKDSIDGVSPSTPSSQVTVSTRFNVEGWPAQSKELKLELERLIGWKHGVLICKPFERQHPLSPMLSRAIIPDVLRQRNHYHCHPERSSWLYACAA